MTRSIRTHHHRLAELYTLRGPNAPTDLEEKIKAERQRLRDLQTKKADKMRAKTAEDVTILNRGLEALKRLGDNDKKHRL